MIKRLISICIIGLLACGIYGCAQTGKDMLVAETEAVETAYTETEDSGTNIGEEESTQSEEVRVKTEDADEMPDAEPYTFSVRNLDDVRLHGKAVSDFYITNAVNYHKGLCYINTENQLYRQIYDFDTAAGKEINENVPDTLIAENVVHIDCDSPTTIILTQEGRLYGMGYGNSSIFSMLRMNETKYFDEPVLLMEDVAYALCGHSHIVVLKKDGSVWTWGSMGYEQSNNYNGYMVDEPIKLLENAVMISGRYGSHAALLEDGTVWTWGDNAYNKCGVPGQGYIDEPICVTQDADAVWMQDLYFNNDLMDWGKAWQYTYNRGHFDNLVIRKKDGSLWACGKNIEGKNSREQDGITYTYEFMPCEIVQQQPIVYDGLNTYQSILQEYERAWEDENYTREQWQEVNDGFVRWNDSKEYASLCYSLSDLTGDGTEELLIGFLIEDTCNVYLIYAYDKQEEVITEVWGFAADRAVTLYEDGIFESFWNSGGVEYYDYYQLQKDSGVRKRLDEYSDNWLWSETAEDRYYKGDVKIGITEEEFWNAVNSYRAMPQIELNWHELDGFWEPEEGITDTMDYSPYLRKIWIVDQNERIMADDRFDFVITQAEHAEIKGYIRLGGGVEVFYFDILPHNSPSYCSFQGTVYGEKAECTFTYKGQQVEMHLTLCENDRIEALIQCDELEIDESYMFRPYNISDEPLRDDISSAKISLDSWGTVYLVTATMDTLHPYPCAYLTNEKQDIICDFPYGINGSEVWDFFIEDINKDGLQDVMAVACFETLPGGDREVYIFIQQDNGLFQKVERDYSKELSEKYYGDYRIVQFCPTADYAERPGEVLTEQEVNTMLGSTVEIKEGLLVTYDSERRRGTNMNRTMPSGDNMVVEFHDEYAYFSWCTFTNETMENELTINYSLREAVGDENYEKIDGVIYNKMVGIQEFFTMKDEDKLIMHSLLTGQYFILEKIDE